MSGPTDDRAAASRDLPDRRPERVARASEAEVVLRLELLAAVSAILAPVLEELDEALQQVAEACVPELCDLMIVEVLDEHGDPRVVGKRLSPGSGVVDREHWTPDGAAWPLEEAVLAWGGPGESDVARALRDHLGVESVIVAPIAAGGVTLGRIVLADGAQRRGLRPSTLRFAEQLSGRISTAVQRVLLYRESRAAMHQQALAMRRMRRLAGAAASLSAAGSPESVLHAACIEVCILADVSGAAATYRSASGVRMLATAGDGDADLLERASAGLQDGGHASGDGWHAWVLPTSDPGDEALLVLRADGLPPESEAAVDSFAALVPVAYERAVGTQAVVLQETRFRSVLDASPMAFFVLGDHAVVEEPNEAARSMFGWEADRPQVLPEELREPLARIASGARHGSAVANESVVVGRWDLAVSAWRRSPVAGGGGRAVAMAATDMSERHRAERALIRAQRFEAMGIVAGQVAHDFNNLLTVITGYSALLERTVSGDTERAMLSKIDEAAQRAAALTRRMLGLTRQHLPTSVVLDLSTAIGGLQQVLEQIAGASVSLEVRLPDGPVPVRSDPVEVEQIVLNLAINACDAMQRKGRLEVSLASIELDAQAAEGLGLPRGRYGRLRVADDGPGMSPEVLARCTEPFFTTKGRTEGSGLGLSTVYALATERGGELTIVSAPGDGTTIDVWLPLTTDGVIEVTTTPSGTPPAVPPAPAVSGSVALVEDEERLRRLAVQSLEEIGLTVVPAASGEELLERLASVERLDLLVTDIVLSGMDGLTLAREVVARRPGTAVLYVTGYAGRPDDAAPLEGSRMLLKPFRPAELQHLAATLVGGAQRGART